MTNNEWEKTFIDIVTGTALVSTPLWFDYLQMWVSGIMMAAGLVLMYLRLRIAWREYKAGKKK